MKREAVYGLEIDGWRLADGGRLEDNLPDGVVLQAIETLPADPVSQRIHDQAKAWRYPVVAFVTLTGDLRASKATERFLDWATAEPAVRVLSYIDEIAGR